MDRSHERKNTPRNVREIYAGYRYRLFKLCLALQDSLAEKNADIERVAQLLDEADRLETLIDLYAYLLANRGAAS